jgi:membrane protein
MSQHQKRWILEQLGASSMLSSSPIGRLWRFVSRDVWRVDDGRLSWPRRALHRVVRVGYLTFKSFAGDHCVLRAMALTYTTVLSLVPLLAFSFATLKGLGWYEELRTRQIDPYLDELFGRLEGPAPAVALESSPAVLVGPPDPVGVTQLRQGFDHVLDMVDRTDVKGLGAIGLLVLVLAVLRLLSSIEASFNEIWGVRKARSWVRKLSDYLTIVIITPIFLVVAVGVTGAAQSVGVVEFIEKRLALGAVVEFGIRAAPLLIGWGAFTLVYLVMPNRRGKFSSAAIGGAVAGLLWQLTLLAHIKFQIGVAKYNAIYAGFAALPIFLAWVQLSWLIVLFGAELAFAHESEREYRGLATYEPRQHAYRESLALRAMTRVASAFLAGEPPPSSVAVAATLGVSPREVDEVLRDLERGRLAAHVDQLEGADGPSFVPARDPATIRVTDILDALAGVGVDAPLPATDELDARVDSLLLKLGEEARTSAYNRSLRDLVDEARRRAAAPEATASGLRAEPS